MHAHTSLSFGDKSTVFSRNKPMSLNENRTEFTSKLSPAADTCVGLTILSVGMYIQLLCVHPASLCTSSCSVYIQLHIQLLCVHPASLCTSSCSVYIQLPFHLLCVHPTSHPASHPAALCTSSFTATRSVTSHSCSILTINCDDVICAVKTDTGAIIM